MKTSSSIAGFFSIFDVAKHNIIGLLLWPALMFVDGCCSCRDRRGLNSLQATEKSPKYDRLLKTEIKQPVNDKAGHWP